jgi:hypothetical protein
MRSDPAAFMTKKIAVLQSNYIPWKGYFDLIGSVDHFIFYDEVQYTKNDWRNRNRIKTPQGTQWLTIPVGTSIHRPISAVDIHDPRCGSVHWKRLLANYARAPYFRAIANWLEPIYLDAPWINLSAINRQLVMSICKYLEIETLLDSASDYVLEGDRNERLVSLCRQGGANIYISGPAARTYLDAALFESAGIEVRWFDYGGYLPYEQLWGPFVHEVSILDLLFNCGPHARDFMKISRR